MIRRPPRSTLDRSSAASDVYKRQDVGLGWTGYLDALVLEVIDPEDAITAAHGAVAGLSLIHISEPTRPY